MNLSSMRYLFGVTLLAAAAGFLAGCAQEAKSGDPGARPLPAGMTCPSIKGDMDRMVGHGVQGLIEGRQSGKKLTPAQNAEADRYNELLNYYLGARCYS